MPVDPERLAQLDAQQRPQPVGSAATVRGLHRTPEFRSHIPIEAVALAPVPYVRDGGWRLIGLLVLPDRSSAEPSYTAPRMAVEWSWPEVRITNLLDLTTQQGTLDLAQRMPSFSARPVAGARPLTSIEQTQRENTLFHALDAVLALPPTAARSHLSSLAPFYAALLPEAVYPYYWLLAPESQHWLRPETISPDATTVAGVSPDELPTAQWPAGAQDWTQPALMTPATPATPAQPTYPTFPTVPTLPASPVTPMLPTTPTMPDTPDAWENIRPARDLRAALSGWIQQAGMLAQQAQAQDIAGELQALDARRQLPGFRLAFVGEFSRGKSTLINRLLGRNALPIGVTPTTATITSLVAGTDEHMDITFPGGRRERRALGPDVWKGLIAELASDGSSNDQTFPLVRVTLNDPWLRSLDAELIDTPGAGDLNERRAALVFDALNQCDAAIFLVSALVPFSLTERTFLEREVIGLRIARVAVIVSHLDVVPPEERAQVIETTRARIAKLAPAAAHIPVIPSHALAAGGDGQAELNQVRSLVESLAAGADRQVWRSQQIAGRIADYLGELETVCETGAAAARMNEQQRDEAARRARAAERDVALRWESLRLDFDQRRLALETDLRKRIEAAHDDMVRSLEHDLKHAPNPKTWWEEDLPYYLYRELGGIGRGCESLLLNALARDTDWLQANLATLPGAQRREIKAPEGELPAAQLEKQRALNLQDMQRIRLFSRIGSGAATVATYFLLGPLGIAVSIGSGLVSEQVINSRVEAQRQVVQRQLGNTVSRVLDAYAQEIFQRLRAFYGQLATELRDEQAAALRAVSAALLSQANGNAPTRSTTDWDGLLAEATRLRSEIISALS